MRNLVKLWERQTDREERQWKGREIKCQRSRDRDTDRKTKRMRYTGRTRVTDGQIVSDTNY